MGTADSPSFTFVHAADLHLDTPFKGIHEVAPHVALQLREASLQAFDNIVDLAIDRHAAFVVIAGDIYDGPERGLRAQLHFRDGLGRLSRAGILSFIVHGNHDPVRTGWSAIEGSWPDGVCVFGSDEVRVAPVLRDGQQIATVQGISYKIRETTENLARLYTRPDSPGFHVGLLHCNVAGAADGYADYSPCTLTELRSSHLDYFALGHVHQRRVLHEGTGHGDPWIVYPGNTQARSPRRGEIGAKGGVVVDVENGAVANVEFVPCDVVRFGFANCSIANIGDLGQLEDRLREIASEELEHADGRALILRVRLVDRGPIHEDLARPGVRDDLVERLRETSGDAHRFCWWDEIDDATRAELDLDTIRGRGDFSSDLLELSDQLNESDIERQLLAESLVSAVPRSVTSRMSALVKDDELLKEIFERATALAFDEISKDAP